MIETAVASGLFKLVLALVGIGVARLALGLYDTYLSTDTFQEWINNADDHSRATYYGLRFLGTCLALGLILG